MRRIYYAHCVALYNTPQETRDFETLTAAFPHVEIVNPNDGAIQAQCDRLRRSVELEYGSAPAWKEEAGARVMDEIFRPLVLSCDIVAFRALPNGQIPAGVLKEVQWAMWSGRPVIELPGFVSRAMSVEDTRQYLREVGQR